MIGLDSSVLISALAPSRLSSAGQATSTGQNAASNQSPEARRTALRLERASVDAPWRGLSDLALPQREARVAQVGRDVLDGRPALSDAQRRAGAPGRPDTQQLFAAWQAVDSLRGLAYLAQDEKISAAERSRLQTRYGESLPQVRDFLAGLKLEDVIVATGVKAQELESRFALRRGTSTFTTDVLHTGDRFGAVAGWAGDVTFTITANAGQATEKVVEIDLAAMGAQTRTMNSVVTFINRELQSAGLLTRIGAAELGRAAPAAGSTTPGPQQWGLRISGSTTEPITFSAAATNPAVTLASTTASGAGELVRLRETGPESRPLTALGQPARLDSEIPGGFTARAAVQDAEGATYIVGETRGAIDGAMGLRGTCDAVLTKLDATGRRLWTRVLGASEAGQGFSVAVGADGRVAVAGAVTGSAEPATRSAGGRDSFVAVFDANGKEQFVRQRGTSADDEARAVAFGADGTLYVGGRSRGAGPDAANAGGWDGFVVAYDTAGAAGFERRFATSADEGVTALALAEDGGLIVAGQEGGRASLRKITTAGQDVWAASTVNLGGGAISAVHVSGSDIVIAGTANAVSDLGLGGVVAAGGGGGRDGFVAKFSDGEQLTADWTRFVGAAGADSAGAVTIANGKVFVAGTETPPGAAARTYIAQLDLSAGEQTARQTKPSGAADGQPIGVFVQANGASVLDRFGLPIGRLQLGDSQVLTERTGMNAGDHFFVRLDGGAPRRIEVRADDTMSTLARRINGLLGATGDALAVSAPNGDRLRLTAEAGRRIEVVRGEQGRDASRILGLSPGMVARQAEPGRRETIRQDAPRVLALEFNEGLNVADAKAAADARRGLEAVQLKLRLAFDSLFDTVDPLAARRQAAAQTPMDERTRAQIAGYKAALARLGGGTAS